MSRSTTAYNEINFVLPYTCMGLQPFWASDLNNLMNNPSNSPVISEKKMFRYVCGSPTEWHLIKSRRSGSYLVLNIKPLSR